MGAEGREWSQDVCEAVSVQEREFGGKVSGRSVPRTGGGIPWGRVA